MKTLDERLLGQVIGILMIGGHVVNRGVNPFLIAADQLVVSGQFPAASPLYQFGFLDGLRRRLSAGLNGRFGCLATQWFCHNHRRSQAQTPSASVWRARYSTKPTRPARPSEVDTPRSRRRAMSRY